MRDIQNIYLFDSGLHFNILSGVSDSLNEWMNGGQTVCSSHATA